MRGNPHETSSHPPKEECPKGRDIPYPLWEQASHPQGLVNAGLVGDWTIFTAQNPTGQINMPTFSQTEMANQPLMTGLAHHGLSHSGSHLLMMPRWIQWSPTPSLPRPVAQFIAPGVTQQRLRSTGDNGGMRGAGLPQAQSW